MSISGLVKALFSLTIGVNYGGPVTTGYVNAGPFRVAEKVLHDSDAGARQQIGTIEQAFVRCQRVAAVKEQAKLILAKYELEKRSQAHLHVQEKPALVTAAAAPDTQKVQGSAVVMEPAVAPQAARKIPAVESTIFVGAAQKLDSHVMPQAVDMTATVPSGSVVVDAASARQVQQNLAAAQTFLTEKARQEQAAGNTAFAQELLEGAQYAGECLKTLAICTAQQFKEKTVGQFYHSPTGIVLQELGVLRPHRSQNPITDPKYEGIVQECCAKAGDKVADALLIVLVHKIGGAFQGTEPPMTLSPQGGVVLAAVAEGAVGVAQEAQAGARAGALLMADPHDADKDIAREQAPQQQALIDDKIDQAKKQQTEILKQNAAKKLTETVLQELRCTESELKSKLDNANLEKQITEVALGKKDITHIKRDFHANGLTIQIKSGHSYFREHLSGDISKFGSLNEIEAAIIEDFTANGNKLAKSVTEGFTEKFTLNFNGYEIEYEPFRRSIDSYSIDYYPKAGK